MEMEQGLLLTVAVGTLFISGVDGRTVDEYDNSRDSWIGNNHEYYEGPGHDGNGGYADKE